MKTNNIPILFLLVAILFVACGGGDFTPKPQAYLRIDIPDHNYWFVDTLPTSIEGQTMPGVTLPFLFEANQIAELTLKKPRLTYTFNADGSITPNLSKYDEVWLDVKYPQWDGVVFLSYKALKSPANLRGQTDTSSRLLETHYQFAAGVDEQYYQNPETHVYGTVYHLKGRTVASPCQFWITDSTSHFLRGALYLNHTPNNDSLAPVIDYIQADIDHLIETINWR